MIDLSDECVHEVPRATCAWCGPKKADSAMERYLGTEDHHEPLPTEDCETRVAMFDGKCARCRTAFEVGETIGWSRMTRNTYGPCCWPVDSVEGGPR